MLCTVKELRQLGYQIKIKHERHFRLKSPNISQDLFVTKGEVKFDDKKVVRNVVREIYDDIADYQKDLETYLDPDSSKKERRESIKRIFNVDNNDGLTIVSIFHQDEIVGVGESKVNGTVDIFGHRDTFCKRIGLEKALDQALRDAHNNKKLSLEILRENIQKLREKESQKNEVKV